MLVERYNVAKWERHGEQFAIFILTSPPHPCLLLPAHLSCVWDTRLETAFVSDSFLDMRFCYHVVGHLFYFWSPMFHPTDCSIPICKLSMRKMSNV